MRTLALAGLPLLVLTGCAQTGPELGFLPQPEAEEAAAQNEPAPATKTAEPEPEPSRPSALPAIPAAQPAAKPAALVRSARQAAFERKGFWPRLTADLTFPVPDHPQVQAFIRFYSEHPAYLDRVFERGRPFLPYIVAQVRQRDMPLDLALLPVVESAFRPFAYSHGRAAGIWQFTPRTGRHFGLDQNWWYDGRRDIVASTNAALDYLEQLHGQFGDWKLALAAYNAGGGTVRSAIRRNRRLGRSTSFWHLDLPRETKGYVPKLIGLSHVLRKADRFDLDLPAIPPHKGFEVVRMEAPLDLAKAAAMAGVEVAELYQLNPGLNQWCTPPEGPHRLLVPRGKGERMERKLAAMDASERVRWTRHRIGEGQTLSEIAADYRTTVAVIREVNDVRGSQITAGEHLLIPTATRNGESYTLSQPQRLARARSSGPSGRSRVIHEVEQGDSLWTIAQRFNVRTEQLAEWNGMAPGDTLRTGQRLTVWVPEASGRDRTAKVRYQVRQGDSLWAIAQQFNVGLEELRSWNNLGQDSILRPGDRVTVFVDPTRLAEHRG